MKLLFVHERLGAFGGAETNLHLAARELKSRGHSLALLHGPATGPEEGVWRELFCPCLGLEMTAPAGAVQRAVSKFGPDLVYMHKMPHLEVVEALARSGVPVVRMVHDHDLYCMRNYKYNVFRRTICQRPASPYCIFPCGAFLSRQRGRSLPFKWASYAAKRKEIRLNQRFDRMIVASNYMKNELLRNGFAEDKIEIHPPVPGNVQGHAGRSQAAGSGVTLESRTSTERNLIVYAGQIIRGKGVDVLLESLAQVEVPFEALIAGDGHHRPFCERLSRRLHLEDRVQFTGFVGQDQLSDYFSRATLAVMSSLWPEPFGAAGLEAMRYGLPVVAFDAGAIREWLIDGYNGFLVPWMDRGQFAARVQQLLLDRALARKMGQSGARLVAERYDFSDYVTALENTFTRVVAERQEEVHA